MKNRCAFPAFLVTVLLLCGAVSAGAPVVVVNKDGVIEKVSSADLKRIYLGRMDKIGMTKIVPINLPLDSRTAAAFLKKYVGKTPEQYKEYWIGQQVKGEGVAPMIQKTAGNVKAMVAQVPGAIGYVDESELDDTVRNVSVE